MVEIQITKSKRLLNLHRVFCRYRDIINKILRVRRYMLKKLKELQVIYHRKRYLVVGMATGKYSFCCEKGRAGCDGIWSSEYYRHNNLVDILGLNTVYLFSAVRLSFEDMTFNAFLSSGVFEDGGDIVFLD
jgi:hypothetical protein